VFTARSEVTFVDEINANNKKVVFSVDDRVLIKHFRNKAVWC